MKNRVIALAGLLQSVEQVQLMANQGQAQTEPLETCIGSLFAFDAADCESVYGNRHQLKPGLKRLLRQLDGGTGRDDAMTRIALNLLHLERQFSRRSDVMASVHQALERIKADFEGKAHAHPERLAELGQLYAQKISPLGPKIMVQGNPVYLAQGQVVAEVRATLLAGLRAAVLWRQEGGSYWDFFLSRARMAQAARQLQGLN